MFEETDMTLPISDESYSERLQEVISSFQRDIEERGLFVEREHFYKNGDYSTWVGFLGYEFPTRDDPNIYKVVVGPTVRVFFRRNGSRNDLISLLQIADIFISIPRTYEVHASLWEIEDLGKIINNLKEWAKESEKIP